VPRKPTYEELKKKVKELERQLADLKEADLASKDYTASPFFIPSISPTLNFYPIFSSTVRI